MSLFEHNLDRNAANATPLSPLDFLRRAAAVYPDKIAVIHGSHRTTYRELYARACRLASALQRRGIGRGDTVAIMAPNTPAMLEAHYGVPMAGAILNSLNIRLDPATIAFVLEHGGAKVLLTDREFSEVVRAALNRIENPPLVVDIDDALAESGGPIGELDYEALLAEGDANADSGEPADEWQSISLLYTSGTTGNPKGVVYHHRGAYLNAFGNMITFGLGRDSVYLWTLPMFHCDGWTFTWAVTAACATHVCLRKVEPARVFALIAEHRVSHMCGAPIVLNALANAPAADKVRFDHRVEIATGGAAPPSALIAPSLPSVWAAPLPLRTAPRITNTLQIAAAVAKRTMRVPTAVPNTLAASLAPSAQPRNSPLDRKKRTVASIPGETRLNRPLDGVDGQAVGHVLGAVGQVVDVLDEVAQVRLAVQRQVRGEDRPLELGAHLVGFLLVEHHLVHVVADRLDIAEEGARGEHDGLHGEHDLIAQHREIRAKLG